MWSTVTRDSTRMPIRRRTSPPSLVAFQWRPVILIQIPPGDPDGIGLLHRKGVDLRGVDRGVNVAGLELLGIYRRNAQGQGRKAGDGNPGGFHCEDLGDLFPSEAFGQSPAHPLQKRHVHAVVEKHIHPDDVPVSQLCVF